jgi:hypothetical protein
VLSRAPIQSLCRKGYKLLVSSSFIHVSSIVSGRKIGVDMVSYHRYFLQDFLYKLA